LRFGFHEGIFRALQARRQSGLVIADSDLSWVARHKNVNWMWLEGASPDQVSAFVGLGRGIDLPGVIHEWGGEPEAVRSLLFDLKGRVPELFLLSSPALLSEVGLSLREDFVPTDMALALVQRAPEVQNPIPAEQLWFWGLDSA
jgi:hypothetical protein